MAAVAIAIGGGGALGNVRTLGALARALDAPLVLVV
jgi:hypothetical protein